jgi:DNA-3-methyladenine glycosylase II
LRAIRGQDDIETGLRELLLIDPRLVPVAAVAGPLPLRLVEPGFAGLASIIASQVVSRASADAIWRRITATGPVTAEAYAALDADTVAGFGLSRAKAAALLNAAIAVREKTLHLDGLADLDTEEAMRQLTSLPGIGPWTAEVYLMFCCGHADVFPAADVALQAAVADAFGLPARPTGRQLAQIAQVWQPWRSVAVRLFWSYYGARTGRNVAPLV